MAQQFRNRGRRAASLTLFIATAALVLAGCGGSSESSDGGSDKVRVVLSEGNSMPFLAADLGNEIGAWDDKGIEVEIIEATSSTVGPTMASKQADISLQGGNRAVSDIVSGIETKLVAADLLPWDQYLIVSNESKASEASELKGATFGISGFGSAGHFATLATTENLGWKEKKDFKIVQMGDLEGLLAGLESGTIDAFLWSIEPALTAEAKGFGKVLGSARDLVGPNVFEAFSVRTEFAEENPKAVKAFFEGYFEAVQEFQSDTEKTTQMVIDEWKLDPKVAARAVEEIVPILSTDGEIPAANLDGLADAVRVTVPEAKEFDIQEMYTYWKDL